VIIIEQEDHVNGDSSSRLFQFSFILSVLFKGSISYVVERGKLNLQSEILYVLPGSAFLQLFG
jgi:hypothetical protein